MLKEEDAKGHFKIQQETKSKLEYVVLWYVIYL